MGKSMIPVPGQAGEDGVPVSDVTAVLQDGAVQRAVRSHHALHTVVLSHVRAQCSTYSAHLDCAVAGVRHVIWRQAHHVVQRLAGQLGRLTYADRRLLGVPHSRAGAAVDILPEQPQQRVALIAVVPGKFQFGSKLSAVYRLPCNGPNIKLLGELPFNRQHIGLLPTVPLRQIVPENDCKLYS